MKRQKGQAIILTIFILGMISVLIGISQVKLGALESFRGRGSAKSLQAYYSANSGIEDAIKRLESGDDSGTKLSVGGEIDNVTVDILPIDDNTKTITSVAKNGNFVRRIKVTVKKSFGFNYAIQAASGGIDLDTNSHVDINPAFAGEPADVWSNSYINGAAKKDTGKGVSEVLGSAYAVNQIGCMAGGGKGSEKNCGVHITKDAWGNNLKACTVVGTKYSKIEPDKNCDGTTKWNSTDPELPITEKTMPELGTTKPANTVASCTMSKTNQDCGSGNYKLGNITVNGDLTIDTPSDVTVEINGPLWVTGNLILKPSVVVGLIQDINDPHYLDSQKITVEGIIESDSNVTFKPNEKDGNAAFLLFASTKVSPAEMTDVCKENVWDKGVLKEVNNAISLSSNTNSVLFYATNGCVLVNQNADFYGAVLGKKVKLDQNAHIFYDPRLSSGSSGKSWKISGFEEY